MEIYKDLLEKTYSQKTYIPMKCEIIIGMCRCYDEMEMYDDSIDIGMEMFEVSRYFTSIHNPVSLILPLV